MSADLPTPTTVVVVDDEPGVRTILERMASFHGLTPVGATTVEEAIATAQDVTAAAFILDLNLKGGRSGLEVLDWLRLQPAYARTPVFVLTGQLDLRDQDRTAIREKGARVFYKGLSTKALFANLKSELIDQNSE